MSAPYIKVLIVDDEPDILEFLSFNLSKKYKVYTAADGIIGWEMAETHDPDIFILDIMMPRMDGLELCRRLRADSRFNNKLIAFLTAKSGEESEIQGLESGADDYISKPLKPKVFVSRVNALARRIFETDTTEGTVTRLGDLVINTEKREVWIQDTSVKLARKEFELLNLLASKPGKVFSREEILNTIWGQDVIVVNRTVDVHVRKLRSKIGESYIKTLKGIGYKLNF